MTVTFKVTVTFTLNSQSFCNTIAIGFIRPSKMCHHFNLYFFRYFFQAADDIFNQPFLLIGRHQAIEIARLDLIVIDPAFLFIPIRIA